MCAEALRVAQRKAEQELAWTALERYPGVETLKIAVQAGKDAKYQSRSRRAVLAIARKLDGKSPEVAGLLSQAGIEPVTVEILKAQYGAGDKQRDVTDILRKQVRNLPFLACRRRTTTPASAATRPPTRSRNSRSNTASTAAPPKRRSTKTPQSSCPCRNKLIWDATPCVGGESRRRPDAPSPLTPPALYNPAQGLPSAATLGTRPNRRNQPQRGCTTP